MDKVYLRRSLKLVPEPEWGEGTGVKCALAEIGTVQKNLECLGFTLSRSLAEALANCSRGQLIDFYGMLSKQLRGMTGANRVMKPMYPNFPKEVMELEEAQLYLNALYHYITLDLPPTEKMAERPPLLERTDLRVIHVGSIEERNQLFVHLCQSKTSLSATDCEDVEVFVKALDDDALAALLPDAIPQRENIALLGKFLLKHSGMGEQFLMMQASVATDVLRLTAAMSDGDISLAAPCRFRSFNRAERRLFLGLIERVHKPLEDMSRWAGRWIRLGERLHPGEYASKFPKAFAAFAQLRKTRTVLGGENSQLEALLEKKDAVGVLEIVKCKPGVFARRLDHLLRIADNPSVILDQFESVADKVASPILLRMMGHFEFRERQHEIPAVLEVEEEAGKRLDQPSPTRKIIESLINVVGPGKKAKPLPITVPNELIRIFFPKGNVAKAFARPDPLPLLPSGIAARASTICREALLGIFSGKEDLGKCWIDPALGEFRVPLANRSASKTLRTLARGTRLALPDANTLRFFIWWKNGRNRTDIDLSAAFYDSRFRFLDTISYYNLKNYGGHHSGDIVDAPKGAAEFIDIDLKKTTGKKVRYVMMVVISFTSQPFHELPECFAGWMARQQADSGEAFEARTVQDKVDLASDTKYAIPVIFDLEKREAIWCDLALRGYPAFNNVENNLKGAALMLRAMMALNTPNLFDLFSLHVEARGEKVSEREEADTTFTIEGGSVSAFEMERIAAEFL